MYEIDSGYWRRKWDDTLGYLIGKEKFTSLDVLNARYRYNRTRDDNFFIQFDDTVYSVVQNLTSGTLDKKLFWAAVVAPLSAFFDGDWRDYAPRGEEFKEINLVRAMNDKDTLAKYPKEKQLKILEKIAIELAEVGMKSTYSVPAAFIEPPKLKRKKKEYVVKKKASEDDVLGALDDLF